jgi:hypothetical protein
MSSRLYATEAGEAGEAREATENLTIRNRVVARGFHVDVRDGGGDGGQRW